MKKSLGGALVATGVLLAFAGISALLMVPYTDPWAIRWKTRMIGPRLTYSPLASDDASWELVLKGVRSGDAEWLSVASDLQPALDTHPGEEMVIAVSTVLDKNPTGALGILLPSYGAELVCGLDIDRSHAERRALLLKGLLASPERQACLAVVMRILNSGGSG